MCNAGYKRLRSLSGSIVDFAPRAFAQGCMNEGTRSLLTRTDGAMLDRVVARGD